MARYPSRAPRALIKPDYKVLMGLGGGLNLSVPPDQLPDIDSPDLLNLTYHMRQLEVAGGLRPLGSASFIGVPQRLFQWEDNSHFTWHILVTSQRVYRWNAGAGDWTLIPFGTGGFVTLTGTNTLPIQGVADPLQNIFIMVNGADPPFYFDGSTIQILPGLPSGLTTARFIARYHQVTVLLNTTEGGVNYPYRVRRSMTGNSFVWIPATGGGPAGSDAGFDDLTDKEDDIHWVNVINPYLVIYRVRSVVRASYLGQGYAVFYYDYGLSNTGSMSVGSVAQSKLYSTIVTTSGVYLYAGDYALTDIGDKIFNFFLNRKGDIEPGAKNSMFSFYVPETDETWIVYASIGVYTPNRVLKFNHKTGSWWLRDFGLKRFVGWGFFNAPPAGYTSIGEDSDPFNKIVLCGSNRQVYLYGEAVATDDAGVAIPWRFTTKDFVVPDHWDTVDGIVFYGQGIIDLVEISLDAGVSWRTWGTNVSMDSRWSRAEVDGSQTCGMIRVRISGVDPNFKLSWMALKVMVASER